MYLTHDEGRLLQLLLKEILTPAVCPVEITPVARKALNEVKYRLKKGHAVNKEQVRKLREAADSQYGGADDPILPYEVNFDPAEATWVTAGCGFGAWVNCWAWVPYEDAGIKEIEYGTKGDN